MTREQEEALEAAKLAAMVSSQLKTVDSLTSDRHSMPANRIDINQFIAKVKGQNYQNQHQPFQQSPFQGPSPYISEDRVQQMVPDVAPQAPNVQELASQMIPLPTPTNVQTANTSEIVEALKNIEYGLQNIGHTLSSMLELIQTKFN
jgi:hypothetical protein